MITKFITFITEALDERQVPRDFDVDLPFRFGQKMGEYIIVAHSTSSKLLPKILKNGLLATATKSWDGSAGKLYFELEPTSSYYGENVYGWKACQKYGGEPVTLYIKVQKNLLRVDQNDKDLGATYRKNQREYSGNIPPENILAARFRSIDVDRKNILKYVKLFC